MGLSLCLIVFQNLVAKLLLLNIFVVNYISFANIQQPSCHDEERSVLMQFRDSFVINKSASSFEGAYPKVLHWKSSSNCCLWDGIDCDAETGHVIGLNLSSSCLFGSINSSSTLFTLVHLQMLSLADNHFSGPIPLSVGKLTQLTYLDLGFNNFNGDIPSSLRNLTHLTSLLLRDNQIAGPFPPWLCNLTKLSLLEIQFNQLHGLISQSLSLLVNLEKLDIHNNNIGGNLKFDMFFNMKNLSQLRLGHNNLSLIFGKANRNATTHQFKSLELSSCKLRKFPHFLRHQSELEVLILGRNEISGQIPIWMWNTSTHTLIMFDVNNNSLTGFDQLPNQVLPWINLATFDISLNKFLGQLPIPPPSIVLYNVSNNMLTGEILPLCCNMSSLRNLDLSDNNLDGIVPKCLGSSSKALLTLSLRNNSFRGMIPQLCSSNNASQLNVIDVSYNQLQGKLPRSLSNCLMLEAILVSNNQLHDSFPSWLGSLPKLKLLILHQNGFYGKIEKPEKDLDFSNLQVLDVSSNSFTGELPSQHFFNWNSMKSIKPSGLRYMSSSWSHTFLNYYGIRVYERYRITITYKGVATSYEAIPDIFAFIDLSDNEFEGEIPVVFGNLKALHSVNFSNNMLTGCIPSSFGNLTELESLDLSRNNLSCHIPQELKQLGFLSSFNVSHNNLIGSIPQGKQFYTFDRSSFDGNPELCGEPLLKKCGNSESLPSPSEEDHKDSKSIFKMDWIFILAGYISGLVVGVVLADIMMKRTPGWLVEMLSKRIKKRRRGRRT